MENKIAKKENILRKAEEELENYKNLKGVN